MKRTALLLSLTVVGTFSANAQPTMVKQFEDWGVYSYSKGGETVCYLLTVPTTKQPASVDHGTNFFVIGQAPGAGYEPQAIMGYELKPGSRVKVAIGDKTFAMFTRGKSAWVLEESREPDVISAMRSGSDMTVEAVSQRGTATTYTYSLNGVTAALKRMASCN
ncbi:invasion associated locus B family protein [Rhizobium cauense]|uniref:invasion associated locus B family protein n=1 Tax=Rhizobium cauense TaxID=1166683 RepID=UPI001C6DF1D6|nr:invasion associated locus B family protein [Rhizobium cauense]MBW9117868.1 invasion associated locus B family protein [Rhizobium cauense]